MRAWLATALVIAMSTVASADPQQQRTEYRWPDWVPWSVVSAGVCSMVAGVFVATEARETQAEFDLHLAAECSTGCSPSQLSSSLDTSLERRVRFENRAAVGLFVAGPAVIITGAVMAYLNRGRTVAEPPSVTVAPAPSGTGSVVTWARSF